MELSAVHLFKARDAEDSYAICLDGDTSGVWRAERGYGSDYEKIWTVELQSEHRPDLEQIDWDAVLERAVEANDLSDAVITNFEWPSARSH